MSEDLQKAKQAAQIYLRVAEVVLGSTRSPLSAREIVERGIERGLFGDHSFGRTPEKSMQARLSLDIKHLKRASRFMRVARGRFLLRDYFDKTDNEAQQFESRPNYLAEYIAEPRRLRLPSESVLCVPEQHFVNILTFQGIDGDYAAVLPHLCLLYTSPSPRD